MDCEPKKFYHEHDFDSRHYLETYYSDKPGMAFAEDSLKFPVVISHYLFSSGVGLYSFTVVSFWWYYLFPAPGIVKGDVLIDISSGSLIHHLYSACDVFKDIILLKLNERCTMETSRWKDTRTGAFTWAHASSHAAKLEGKSAEIQDKDEQLKTSISHVISCDFENENITYPVVLPLADCVTSLLILDFISNNEDKYIKNLEKISKLLRPGGHVIIGALLNASYFLVAGEKFHILKYDESFVKAALSKLGFVIDYCAVQRRRDDSKLTDYKAVMFIAAFKTK